MIDSTIKFGISNICVCEPRGSISYIFDVNYINLMPVPNGVKISEKKQTLENLEIDCLDIGIEHRHPVIHAY